MSTVVGTGPAPDGGYQEGRDACGATITATIRGPGRPATSSPSPGAPGRRAAHDRPAPGSGRGGPSIATPAAATAIPYRRTRRARSSSPSMVTGEARAPATACVGRGCPPSADGSRDHSADLCSLASGSHTAKVRRAARPLLIRACNRDADPEIVLALPEASIGGDRRRRVSASELLTASRDATGAAIRRNGSRPLRSKPPRGPMLERSDLPEPADLAERSAEAATRAAESAPAAATEATEVARSLPGGRRVPPPGPAWSSASRGDEGRHRLSRWRGRAGREGPGPDRAFLKAPGCLGGSARGLRRPRRSPAGRLPARCRPCRVEAPRPPVRVADRLTLRWTATDQTASSSGYRHFDGRTTPAPSRWASSSLSPASTPPAPRSGSPSAGTAPTGAGAPSSR